MDVGDLYRFIGDGPLRATLARLAGWDVDALTPEQSAELDRQEAEIKGQPSGRALGPYVLVEALGKGATSDVWKAWDTKLRRWVAVKEARLDSPASKERFLREARAASKVRHPHLIDALDVGDGWLAMTLVDGLPLDRVKHDPRSAAAALADVAGAVQALHAAGLIHRDIKPGNILQDREGRAILADFGIAKDLSAPTLTLEGSVIGTPHYMAPEQAQGKPVGAAADVYALGATLYHLAGGVPPFPGETLPAILASIATRTPPPPRGVPAPLVAIMARAMEKRPEDRYPTAAAFSDDLRRYLRGEPVDGARGRARRWLRRNGLVLAACSVLAALLCWGVLWMRWSLRATTAYSEAVELWARGDVAGAESLLARLDSPEAALMRARCLLRMGNPREAHAVLNRLLVAHPDHGPALLERGKLRLAEAIHQQVPVGARWIRGRVVFERRAKNDDPDLARAREAGQDLTIVDKAFLIGEEDLRAETFNSASGRLGAYADANPWDAAARSLHAAAAFLKGDYETAEASLTKAIALEPTPGRFLARGDARFAAGRYEAALEDYSNVGEESRRALALQALSRPDEAETAFTRSTPTARTLVNRGRLRAERMDLAGARKDFEAALELNEKSADAYHNLASLDALEKDFESAVRHYDLALTCDDRFTEAYAGRARARLHLGQLAAAAADLDRAAPNGGLGLDPELLIEVASAYRAAGQDAKARACLISALGNLALVGERRKLVETWLSELAR